MTEWIGQKIAHVTTLEVQMRLFHRGSTERVPVEDDRLGSFLARFKVQPTVLGPVEEPPPPVYCSTCRVRRVIADGMAIRLSGGTVYVVGDCPGCRHYLVRLRSDSPLPH